jgi:hypothetical protein
VKPRNGFAFNERNAGEYDELESRVIMA